MVGCLVFTLVYFCLVMRPGIEEIWRVCQILRKICLQLLRTCKFRENTRSTTAFVAELWKVGNEQPHCDRWFPVVPFGRTTRLIPASARVSTRSITTAPRTQHTTWRAAPPAPPRLPPMPPTSFRNLRLASPAKQLQIPQQVITCILLVLQAVFLVV